MTYRSLKIAALLSLAACFLPSVAWSQFPSWRWQMAMASEPQEAITGMGMVTVPAEPSRVRMVVEVLGTGKSLEEALGNLKDRQEAAKLQLDALKADKASIKIGSPTMSTLPADQRMQMMIRQRMMNRGRAAAKKEKPKTYTLTATLTAEWPLTAASPEQLLLSVHQLQEKVKAADLAGAKSLEKATPEEEEEAEEMQEMTASDDNEKVELGVPHFVYVARISDEQRAKAMAEAFQKAKTQAMQSAQAAGIELGELKGVNGQGAGESSYDEDGGMHFSSQFGYAQQQYMRQLMQRGMSTLGQPNENETLGSDPAQLKFTFHVTAVFGMKK
jgi:uncharacterized protein YggE